MATLQQILMDTLPYAAAGDQSHPNLASEPSTYTDRVGDGLFAVPAKTGLDTPDNPKWDSIWRWQHDEGTLNTFRNVTCRVRGMGYMEHTVCDTIEFGHTDGSKIDPWIEVVRKRDNKTFILELSAKHLVRREVIDDGPWLREGRSTLWPLEAVLDYSMLLVFAYELSTDTSCVVGSIVKEKLERPDFMMDNTLPVTVAPGHAILCDLTGERVVVALSLTCIKELNNFTPGRILGVGRLYPHIMVQSSTPLKTIEAAVRLSRPTAADHAMDGMTAVRGSMLFTDTNVKRNAVPVPSTNGLLPTVDTVPPPFWDNIFDYYSLNAPSDFHDQDLHVVKRSQRTERALDGAISRPMSGKTGHTIGDDNGITKKPRQGEFDNLHIAPRMVAPLVTQQELPGLHLNEVAMAPFCIHDCLHTHVRWGAPMEDKFVRGFDNNFTPCAVAGAPLVPHNQDVWFRLTGPSSFVYKCQVSEPIEPRRWQVVMHHGSAYALAMALSPIKETAMRAGVDGVTVPRVGFSGGFLPLVPVPAYQQGSSFEERDVRRLKVARMVRAASDWWAFYARLRFIIGTERDERLQIKDLAQCRQL